MSLREKRMGKAVPRSATATAPAIKYVLLSADTSPTAETLTTLEDDPRPGEGSRTSAGGWDAVRAVACGRGEAIDGVEREAAEAISRVRMKKVVRDWSRMGIKDIFRRRWRKKGLVKLGPQGEDKNT